MTFFHIIVILLQMLFIPMCSPLIIGMIRKMKARLQNREGASVFQPYFDILKLFRKDEIISEDASWIFLATPFLVFGVTVLVGMGIPMLSLMTTYTPLGDFLTIVYILLIATFFTALAGMDTGSGFGGFGSSREMMVSALAEGGLLFSFLTPALVSGTTNVTDMVTVLSHIPSAQLLPVFIAFVAFFIALLAENSRFPVDNPSTHLELTMIHEAMILEYSGKRLALMEWAAANKLLIFIALGGSLFFPWGIGNDLQFWTWCVALFAFVVKTGLFISAIALLESLIAKFRIFRVPDLLFTSLVLGIIALGSIITI